MSLCVNESIKSRLGAARVFCVLKRPLAYYSKSRSVGCDCAWLLLEDNLECNEFLHLQICRVLSMVCLIECGSEGGY